MFLIIPRQNGRSLDRGLLNKAKTLAEQEKISLIDAYLIITDRESKREIEEMNRELDKPRRIIKCKNKCIREKRR